jgi:hypothetical protein
VGTSRQKLFRKTADSFFLYPIFLSPTNYGLLVEGKRK